MIFAENIKEINFVFFQSSTISYGGELPTEAVQRVRGIFEALHNLITEDELFRRDDLRENLVNGLAFVVERNGKENAEYYFRRIVREAVKDLGYDEQKMDALLEGVSTGFKAKQT